MLCATGVSWRRLDLPGVDELLHAGVYYGSAVSEAPGLRGKDVFVIGGGNSAGQAAMNFASVARTVTVVVRGAGLSASMSTYLCDRIDEAPNVTVRTHCEVTGVAGDDWLRAVTLCDTRDDVETVKAAHALVHLHRRSAPHGLGPAGQSRSRHGWVPRHGPRPPGTVHHGRSDLGRPSETRIRSRRLNQECSPPVTLRHGSTKRVSAAVGEGSMAVGLVHRFLTEG